MKDPYTEMAAKQFGVSVNEVTPEMRAKVKHQTFISRYSVSVRFIDLAKGKP